MTISILHSTTEGAAGPWVIRHCIWPGTQTHPRVPVRAVEAPSAGFDSKAKDVTAGSTPHRPLLPGCTVTANSFGKAGALNQLGGITPSPQWQTHLACAHLYEKALQHCQTHIACRLENAVPICTVVWHTCQCFDGRDRPTEAPNAGRMCFGSAATANCHHNLFFLLRLLKI
jgi:hypothetical protein